MVRRRPNLLLLDEPTNHLDLDMRHALTRRLRSTRAAWCSSPTTARCCEPCAMGSCWWPTGGRPSLTATWTTISPGSRNAAHATPRPARRPTSPVGGASHATRECGGRAPGQARAAATAGQGGERASSAGSRSWRPRRRPSRPGSAIRRSTPGRGRGAGGDPSLRRGRAAPRAGGGTLAHRPGGPRVHRRALIRAGRPPCRARDGPPGPRTPRHSPPSGGSRRPLA